MAEFDLAGDGVSPLPRAAPISGLGATLAFGFGAHFFIALVNILATPILLKLMGVEAYGLVAFFLVLQGWMLLFDLGISPALARQLSRYRAGAIDAAAARGLMAAAETVFIGGGVAAGLVLALASPWIAVHWLHSATLSRHELDLSLRLIAVLLVFRWLTGLYQSALVGLERQNLVNALAAASVALRYGAAVAALALVARTPAIFFAVQAAFTVAEAVISRLLLGGAMPKASARPDWRGLKAEFRFAAGLTLASAAATLIGQADRLALSHALPLTEFGLFGLVVQISAGITLVVPPFAQAFQPRLTSLLARHEQADFAHVYRLASGLILALSVGLAGTIAAQPEWVVWAWTGRLDAARHLAPALSLYAAGGAIAAYLFVPFLLQYAQGKVRLHVIGNVAFAVVWVPAAVIAAFRWGPVGAGAVWLIGNLLYLLLWTPRIHKALLSKAERRGLDLGVWLRGAALAALLAATRYLPLGVASRPAAFAALAVISLAVTALAAASSREIWTFAAHLLMPSRRR
ncbi:MAG TPA: oligosaccharide flippase family protein [Caulobacteraceae bacterium]|jgi:O-antigen/teichoic acid export membrane protein